MTTADLARPHTEAEKWQRLAPAAMIHFAVQFIVQFIKQGVQGLLPLGAVFLTAGENRWFIISLAGASIALLLLVGAILSYLKFRYRLSGDMFLIQKGVFKRKRLSLSYDRIQNVAFKQPIYFRPFNLVVLGIESAGSSSEEVSLGGIPRALAEEIRTSVFEKRAANTSLASTSNADDEPQATSTEAEDIIRQPIGELVRYGLSNNNIWVFASLAAAAFAQIEWDDYVLLAGLKDWLKHIPDDGPAFAILFGVGSFLAIVTLLLGLSALGAIVTYYNYHLTFTDGRFHRSKGLFERQETSLPKAKVQSLVINQSWPARLLKRYHLVMRQVGFQSNAGQPSAANNSKFLVPSVTGAFTQQFSRRLYPDFNWSVTDLRPINWRFTRKIVLYIMLPIAAIPTTAISLAVSPVGVFILLIPLLLTPLVMLRRARYGYASNGTHGIVRSGFIGHKLTVFPFYKVQTVELVQTPGQRKHGLASLKVKLAGFGVELPYIPLADAEAWRDQILYRIENHKGKWM